MQKDSVGSGEQTILSVSQITDKIKVLLENNFPFVWITGEISNFSSPMSGHFYFSLKDDAAQISAVMFRGQNRHLKFVPTNGMSVTGLGRISLYKPRGTYQVIFEYLEPRGIGALQIAFEQLKAKLADEGLFDEQRKAPLPFLPQKIALITSPTGAVLQDMMKIARRRFKNLHFMVVPVMVQGVGAVQDIVRAIARVNRYGADVAIIARGGGSFEDLQAFNSEPVARAIARSRVPIVSAIGHETDYTIADFVADLRAPTPSAAVEMVVPRKDNLLGQIDGLVKRMRAKMNTIIKQASSELNHLSSDLIDPVKKIQDLKLKNDDITEKMMRAFRRSIHSCQEQLTWRIHQFNRTRLKTQLTTYSENILYLEAGLKSSFLRRVEKNVFRYNTLTAKINTLSPLAVLDRGYSITRTLSGKNVVRSSGEVEYGQALEILLSKGALSVSVTEKRGSVDTPLDSEQEKKKGTLYGNPDI